MRARAPVLLFTDIPPCFPPTLTPTLFLPTFSFTPGAILKLFLDRNPILYSPFLLIFIKRRSGLTE